MNTDQNKEHQSDCGTEVDWGVYRNREKFTLYELACLVNRLDPEAVNADAVKAIRQERTFAQTLHLLSGEDLARRMWASPAMFFRAPVGDTLDRMKKAAGSTLGLSVMTARAYELTQSMGIEWPQELVGLGVEAPNTNRPLQRQTAQEAEILNTIKKLGWAPRALPKRQPGTAGTKSAVRAALVGKNRLFPKNGTQFDKAWDRLRAAGEIVD